MFGRILQVARRVGAVLAHILVYVLIWAGLALLIAAAGIRYFWGEISVGQMLLNLVSVETEGGGGAIVWLGIFGIGVAPLLITGMIAVWQYFRRRKRRNRNVGRRAMTPHRREWLVRSVSTFLVAAVVVGGTTAFSSTVGLWDYIKAGSSSYNLGDYYVEPTVVSDEDKRNLVVIYIESGEATLGDDQLFEKDAFAPLNDVTPVSEGWQSMEDFQQYRGGGWTMAGLTSTQCGIPLKGSGPQASGDPNLFGDQAETYMGGATCVGDVLEEHGYTSAFLGGANGAFAAKDTFLGTHGYSIQKHLPDWKAMKEPDENFRYDWGLSDERLMDFAKEEIDALHAEAEKTGQPFNLTMLTLDTHEPVHVYDDCNVDTESPVTSVFACSAAHIAGFVDYMEEKGYLEDTAVVIMGDHLKHMSAGDAFHEQLDHHENRTIYNRIWVPGQDENTKLRAGADQLSAYPTMLEAAGLTLKDHEAGVGVSVFAPEIPTGSAQALAPEAYAELIDSRSAKFYEKVWSQGAP